MNSWKGGARERTYGPDGAETNCRKKVGKIRGCHFGKTAVAGVVVEKLESGHECKGGTFKKGGGEGKKVKVAF